MNVSLSRAGVSSLASLLLAATFAGCGGPKTPKGPIDGNAAMRHVEALVQIGPRPFGSDALAKAADYISGELTKAGLEVKRHEIDHEREKKRIRNLYVQIDGEDPVAGPILMFGAHYDTKLAAGHADAAHNFPFVGAIDGGGAPAVLIEMAKAVKAMPQKPKCNVWFYFIDAEESIDWQWSDERALLGSKAFAKMLSETKQLSRVKAFVLLDLIGSKDIKIDLDGNSNPQLQKLIGTAAKELGIDDRVGKLPTEAEIQRQRQWAQQNGKDGWGITDDHVVFGKTYGVPSVLLIDFARRIPDGQPQEQPKTSFEQWWHTADDNLDAMDASSLAFAGNLVMHALPALENFVMSRK